MLSEEEHDELTKLPNGDELIEHFSQKLAAKGYRYDNHYAAILCWQAEDSQGKKNDSQSDEYWEEFFRLAMQRG